MFYLLSHLGCGHVRLRFHIGGENGPECGRQLSHPQQRGGCFLAIYLPGKYDIISLGSRLFILRIKRHEQLIPFVMIVAAP